MRGRVLAQHAADQGLAVRYRTLGHRLVEQRALLLVEFQYHHILGQLSLCQLKINGLNHPTSSNSMQLPIHFYRKEVALPAWGIFCGPPTRTWRRR